MAYLAYTFTPYDVLQVQRDGAWLDVSTLRTAAEADQAVAIVGAGRWLGQTGTFRIITPGIEAVRYPVVASDECP
jgi:hypothetical protein